MSLVLVGDRKGIRPQTLHQLPLMECTFPPVLILHRRPYACMSRIWWDGVKKRMYGEGELRVKPTNAGSPLNWMCLCE